MNIGVWVDSQRAVIIRLTESGFESRSVESGNEAHHTGSAGDDLLIYNDASHLNAFYEKIIAAVRGADSVLIFGPGEEKVELGVRIPGSSIGEHIAGIITAPAMTDAQIAAKIRSHFGVPAV
jgi:hypothetical protein